MKNNELYIRKYEKGKTRDGSHTGSFMRILHMDPEKRFMLYQAVNANVTFMQDEEFTKSKYWTEQELEAEFKRSGYIGKYGFEYTGRSANKEFDSGLKDDPEFILYHSPVVVQAGLWEANDGKVPPTEDFDIYVSSLPRGGQEPGYQYTSDQIRTVYSDPKRVVRKMRDEAILKLSQYAMNDGLTTKDAIEKFLTKEDLGFGSINSIDRVPQEFQNQVKAILEKLVKELEPNDKKEREHLKELKAKRSKNLNMFPYEVKLKNAKYPTRKMIKNPAILKDD